jgi:two-component system chemotaxis sensor kinase CheA
MNETKEPMQKSDKLAELVEKAASAVNLLDVADMTSVEGLQSVLTQISKAVDEMGQQMPSEILTQAKGKSADAVGVVEKILTQELKDSSGAVQSLSRAVMDMQELVEQMETAAVATEKSSTQVAAPVSAPTVSGPVSAAPETEKASQDAMLISDEDKSLILDFINEATEHVESCEGGLLALENKPGDNETLNLIFRAFHTIKGMAGFLNLAEIGSLAHSAENLLDLARKGEMVLAGKNMDVIFESVDLMKKMITSLKCSLESGEPIVKQPQLPDLIKKLKTVAENKGCDPQAEIPMMPADDAKLDKVLEEKASSTEDSAKSKSHSTDETIKVNTVRLDNLINMVGELVIAQLMVAEDVNKTLTSENSLSRNVAHQSKITRELQELSMSMRMVPISGVFQKMTRLVRDLSQKAAKKVNLSISGEDTELDRNIVDKIADPLVHMIRNSVDHGIEPAEDRIKAGKNPAGQIKLRAFHQSGNIVIEIEDDGKGLDKDRILKKAIKNGIISPDQQLSDQEIFKLIYHAGLSTAEKVTSVSGRGVGMDVVKKNVESLRGRIDIASVLGKGTTFVIRLPLTLAIIDGQIVTVGKERYILPISSIVRSFRPNSKQVSTVQNTGEVVMVRGQLLPLIRLHKLFGIASSVDDPTHALVVVVEEDGKRCCLLVDELLGQQQVVIKSLGEGMGAVKGVSGGAIMGDGKISLILDVPGLTGLARN